MRAIVAAVLVYFVLLRVDLFTILANRELAYTSNEQVSRVQFVDLKLNKTNASKKNLPPHADTINYKTMPPNKMFHFNEDSPYGKKCYLSHNFGGSNTESQICRIGLDNSSAPVYFLFGDSLSMVNTNLFNQFEQPGMFAALNGQFCSPLLRSDNSPGSVTANG
jgi:hypothetical protein